MLSKSNQLQKVAQIRRKTHLNKSLDQLISSLFVFNLHQSTCSLRKFSLLLIGKGMLGNQSLLASEMMRLIFIGYLTKPFGMSDYRRQKVRIGQFGPETAN